MAAANAPITVKEALTLPNVGINPEFITSTHVTMESDKYICIRETQPQNSLVIVDMSMPMQPLRLPITTDSALMHPKSRILALKNNIGWTARDHLQIFNIEMKANMKLYKMPEQIVFWKWITPEMLGLVTQTTVYHWSIEGDLEPVKMFERAPNLSDTKIIDYRCDPTEKWLALIGIDSHSLERSKLVSGNMQLFSVDRQLSKALEANAASFASFKVAGNENPSILICFASKTIDAGQITSKLHVVELGALPGKQAFTRKQEDLFFPPDFADDFPVAVQISRKYSLVYVITKLGLLFVYDLETATQVYRNRISPDPIFLTTEASSVGGFYAVNQQGQVLLATVNEGTIVPFVSGQVCLSLELSRLVVNQNKKKLLENRSAEDKLECSEELSDQVVQRFQELFAQTKYKEAAELAAESPQGILRTPDTLAKFQSAPVQAGQTPPCLQYFGTLLNRGKLNAFESLELSRLAVNQNKKNLLENWLVADKLECSEELGDLVKTMDNDLALEIYIKVRETPKVLAAFVKRWELNEILKYSKQVGYTHDYLTLLQRLLPTDPRGAVMFSLMMFQMEGGCPVDYNTIKNLFLQRNLIHEATTLDMLKQNLPKHELHRNLPRRAFLPTKKKIDETMALVMRRRDFLNIFNQSQVQEDPWAVKPKTTPAKLVMVPKVLRDDKNVEECFVPKFVSIGPYHHGNKKLQEAEELKKNLARQFVVASDCSAEILYGNLYKEIEQIRNFYDDELMYGCGDEELTEILFVDGCFLLFFIYRLLWRKPLMDFNLQQNNIGSVLWDSILLENQLPFLVLKLLGVNNFEYWPLIAGYIEFICNNFLPIKQGWKMYNLQPGDSCHLVQLLQIRLQGLYEVRRDVKYLDSPPPNYSVTELKKVGIHCKPSQQGNCICTRFNPHWFHGVLELPSMVVGPFTRRNLLNLIAYEMHPDVRRSEVRSYLIFLASLVRQPQDVKALREARVLYNYIGSDEEVVELFKEVSAKSSPEKMLGYDGIQMQIGRYINKKGKIKIATWLAEVFNDYCSSPWTAIGVLVVFLSVSAAIIQVVLQIVSNKKKKVE